MTLLLGSDVLFDGGLLRGRTIGLVCNPASIDGQFRHIVDRAGESEVRVGALFGPQHGFRSDLQENMIETSHAHDDSRQAGCAGRRPAGRRHPHLHLRLYDG